MLDPFFFCVWTENLDKSVEELTDPGISYECYTPIGQAAFSITGLVIVHHTAVRLPYVLPKEATTGYKVPAHIIVSAVGPGRGMAGGEEEGGDQGQ